MEAVVVERGAVGPEFGRRMWVDGQQLNSPLRAHLVAPDLCPPDEEALRIAVGIIPLCGGASLAER